MTQFSVPALETSNEEFESVPALRFTELLTQQTREIRVSFKASARASGGAPATR